MWPSGSCRRCAFWSSLKREGASRWPVGKNKAQAERFFTDRAQKHDTHRPSVKLHMKNTRVTKTCSTLLRRVWSCQDVTSPSQPCHEGPPTWTHTHTHTCQSQYQPSIHFFSSETPGQGLSLNRRHLPVVSIAQLSVILHYFLNLCVIYCTASTSDAWGRRSRSRGAGHLPWTPQSQNPCLKACSKDLHSRFHC